MAQITRFTVDLVTEDGISERRAQILAAELTEWLHLLGVEQDDSMKNVHDKYVNGHVHDASDGRCRQCHYHANDGKNGDMIG